MQSICDTCGLEKIGGHCYTRWCDDRHSSVDELFGDDRELRTDGGQSTTDTERYANAIRYNVPRNADAAAFDAEANFTLHVGGITVYFDRIREEGREGRESYVFVKHDADVAFVPYEEWDASPMAAKAHAECHPGEKVRFADPRKVQPDTDREPITDGGVDRPDLPFEALIEDPETAAVYFGAVSHLGETMAQTIVLSEDLEYEKNVALTSAAFLDGIQRCQQSKDSKSLADFIEDVMAEVKERNSNKSVSHNFGESNE